MDLSPYAVPLAQLERGVRVPWQEQVELSDTGDVPDLDPGPPHPDREWFAAGG